MTFVLFKTLLLKPHDHVLGHPSTSSTGFTVPSVYFESVILLRFAPARRASMSVGGLSARGVSVGVGAWRGALRGHVVVVKPSQL